MSCMLPVADMSASCMWTPSTLQNFTDVDVLTLRATISVWPTLQPGVSHIVEYSASVWQKAAYMQLVHFLCISSDEGGTIG